MEVCRQTTIWAQPATDELEDEINSNSSSIHKQPAPSSWPGFSTKRTDGDLDAERGDIGNSTTNGNDGCDADDEDEDGLMQEELNLECSMCGHAGLPQYLFKCLCCSCRFQHTYCSKLYPYSMEASMCNWCLPLKPETAAEEDDDDNIDGVYNCGIANSDIATESDTKPQPPQQVQQIKKHSKAFEYLLQITADLADEIGCNQLTEAGGNHQTEHSPCCNNDAGQDQITRMCRLQQNNTIKEDLIEGKSITARTGEAESFNSALSHPATTPSKRPRGHVNGSWKPGDCDQVLRKRTDHNKVYDYKVDYDQDLWMQSKSFQIDDDEKGDVTASINAQKRLRVICKKQSMGIARGVDCISNLKAANRRESFPLLQAATAKMSLDNVAADDDDDDERRSPPLRNKQISPPVAAAVLTSTWVAATAQSKPAAVNAGKRDHLTNSPSRAFNRRYKLLADVLC